MPTARASDVLGRHFETFGNGGLEAAAEFWHPEIEWRAIEGAADDVGVIHGRDEMRSYYADWVEAMDDLRAMVEEIVFEDDEVVAALIRNSGRGRVSGAPAAGAYYVACVVRQGQIVLGHEYGSREEAIAAAQRLRD